jgi:hypothetical protein
MDHSNLKFAVAGFTAAWPSIGPNPHEPMTSRGSRLAIPSDMEHPDSIAAPPERASQTQSPADPAWRVSSSGRSDSALDDAIAASFPASDPPSWTTGTATAAPFLPGE